MNKALVVVDVQNDFCEGGSLAVAGGNEVAQKIRQFIVDMAGDYYDFVVATRDYHKDPGDHFKEWPAHCVIGTHGAQLHPALEAAWFDAIFDKGLHTAAYSGFEGATHEGATLAQWLEAFNVQEIDVCGIATDYCVKATVLDGVKNGVTTTLIPALTAAVGGPVAVAAVIEEIREAGADTR